MDIKEQKRFRNVWSGMHYRCRNDHARQYKHYGGRGISVCDEWCDFECFKKWAFANGYKPGLSIDRIDNDGPYSPKNCKWSTQKEQVWNSRRTRKITFFGQTKSISQWAEHMGISRAGLRYRLRNWPLREVFTKKPIASAARYRNEH